MPALWAPVLLLLLVASASLSALAPARAADLQQTEIASSLDQTPQPLRYFAPENPETPIPLLVVLHTWSGDYRQTGFIEDCLQQSVSRGWALIHPQFRGPNIRPEAGGSNLAVQDVLDAVDWISRQTRIDPRRIYLVGASGGGHMTLLMAGRHPERWAAASAWVPIADLAAWHAESVARKQRYAEDVEKLCGGVPGASAQVDAEYRHRSPLTWLPRARNVPLDIEAGIHDGHTGSVPVSHSLNAFNVLAVAVGKPDLQFADADIRSIVQEQRVPESFAFRGESPAVRKHKILLQRSAGPARVTLFEGGHEGDMAAAIDWLAGHQKSVER